MARANGDLKPPPDREDRAADLPPQPPIIRSLPEPQERMSSGKRSSELEGGPTLSAKKTRTVLNTYVEPANIVDVSDSDDDIGKFY